MTEGVGFAACGEIKQQLREELEQQGELGSDLESFVSAQELLGVTMTAEDEVERLLRHRRRIFQRRRRRARNASDNRRHHRRSHPETCTNSESRKGDGGKRRSTYRSYPGLHVMALAV
jgi:hypothetical protein|eukprot:COSAG01_NODE_2848_length_6979_cov_12.425000_5_plen_118_part_00